MKTSKSSMIPIVCSALIACALGIFIGFGLVSFFFIGPHEATTTEFKPVSYTDFVTILLSVVTVLLAILGIFLAILAVFGYSVLKNAASERAKEAAQTVANKIVSESLEADGQIHNLILSRLKKGSPLRKDIEEMISRGFYASIGDDSEGLDEDDRDGGDDE